jgi:dienelactone hydrolase
MAEVVLFHSVFGLRPAVGEAADRLRAAGHTVHTPDLFDGHTFDDYEPAFAWVKESGISDRVADLTLASVESLPSDLVYAGYSYGGYCAEMLAATRPGDRGLVLFHSAIALEDLEVPSWPATVPVQVHYALDDPYREQEELEPFEAAVRASGAGFELFDYAIPGHLFTDRGLPNEYHEESAELLYARVLEFLAGIDKA